jgi:hypothetical protein
MDDKDIQRDVKHWPFVVREKNGKPAVSVKYKGETRDFVSLASFVLALSIAHWLDSHPKRSAPWFSAK